MARTIEEFAEVIIEAQDLNSIALSMFTVELVDSINKSGLPKIQKEMLLANLQVINDLALLDSLVA